MGSADQETALVIIPSRCPGHVDADLIYGSLGDNRLICARIQ